MTSKYSQGDNNPQSGGYPRLSESSLHAPATPPMDALAALRRQLQELGVDGGKTKTPSVISAFRDNIIANGNGAPPLNVTMILSPQIPTIPPQSELVAGTSTIFIPPFSLGNNGSASSPPNGEFAKNFEVVGETGKVLEAWGILLEKKELELSAMILIKTFSIKLIDLAEKNNGDVVYNKLLYKFNGLRVDSKTFEGYVSLSDKSNKETLILYAQKNDNLPHYFLVDGINNNFNINLHQ